MGAVCSEVLPKEMQCLFDAGKHPLVTQQASLAQKSQALQAIKKDDKVLLKKLLYQVPPTENLFKPGANQTLIHFAAALNSYKAMGALLSFVDANNHDNYAQIINIPDAGQRTPAMVCAGNNAPDSLYVLLSGGSVDFSLKDRESKSLEDIAKERSMECYVVIEHFRNPENAAKIEIVTKDPENPKKTGAELIKEIQQKLAPPSVKASDPFLVVNTNKKVDPSKRIKNPEAEGIPQDSDTYTFLETSIRDKKTFDDTTFPHTIKSITDKTSHESYDLFKQALWVRPGEMFGTKYDQIALFDGISPNDIKQGALGVCYFLTAMSSLAEFPERLQAMYLNDVSNQYGVYGMRFIVQGVPREIVVDDYFPCTKNGSLYTPIFSRPNGRELWALIAEKAWAKLFGNYCICEAGFMDEAFEYLLGEPAYRGYLTEEKPDEAWKVLLEADTKKWILCAATKSQEDKKTGLVAGHAYTILSTYEIDGLKLIKLRNPWGKFEWTGDYSDKSDKWTEDLKVAVGWSDADDGVFFMTFADFLKSYEFYSIGVHEEGWNYNYIVGEYQVNHATFFSFTAKDNCEAYFRVHLKDLRFLGGESSGLSYPSVDIIVCRKEADGTYTNLVTDPKDLDIMEVGGSRTVYPTCKRRMKLTKGEYVIRVALQPGKYPLTYFTLSAYSSTKIELQKATFNHFFRLVHVNQLKTIDQNGKKNVGNNCFITTFNSGNTLVLAAENKSPNLKWRLEFKITKKDNLKLGKAHRVSDTQFKMEILPGKSETCYLKKLDLMKGHSLSYEISTHWG